VVSDVLGLAVVGPGGIAREHARAWSQLDVGRNLWVVGKDDETARAFADEWSFAHTTTDLDEMLADDAVDVVLIASPNGLHAGQAIAALEAGKHAIVEIPVAMTFADAEAVVARADAAGARALVCHTMRSFPAIRLLRERVQSGELVLSQVTGFTATPRRNNDHWIGGQRGWVDNLLWHNSCHYLDASLWVLGADEVVNVCAQFGRPNPTYGMRMDVAVSFATSGDELVSFSSTYNCAVGTSQMRFVGDRGLFTLDGNRLLDDAGTEIVPGVAWADLLPQDRAMLESLRDGTLSDFEAESVLPAMRLLEAAQAWEHAEQTAR
jgi:2-hydroxy-4-carboxymuconate semialdehyde hemiacetal dehydrogenase